MLKKGGGKSSSVPGCEDDVGELRLQWPAIAATKVTKHGNDNLAEPRMYRESIKGGPQVV